MTAGTSTKILFWEKECETWAQSHLPFKLEDVETDCHNAFCKYLASKYYYSYKFECPATAVFSTIPS